MGFLYTLLGIAALVVILALGRAALVVLGALIQRFAGPVLVLCFIVAGFVLHHIWSYPNATYGF